MLLSAVFILFFLALAASIYYGFFILYPLLFGLLGVGFVAWRRGHSVRSVAVMGYQGAMQSLIVIKVLVHLGALTAAWRSSGVVCFLVFHGLQLLSPQYFLEGAFLLSAAFSFLVGTSLGTVSVLGIALIVIAKGGGLSVPMAAGAIIAGAFFGDRGSPMSSSANLVAGLTHTNLYNNIKNMMRSACIPMLLSMGAYAALASSHGLQQFDPVFIGHIATAFPLHPAMIIPPVIILLGSACRIRVSYTIPASTISALLIAVFVQGHSLWDIAGFVLWGYTPAVESPVSMLFAGGGWVSIVNAALVVFISSAFAGIFSGAQLLHGVEMAVRRMHARCGAYLTNMLVSWGTAAAACNQTLALLLTSQLQFDLHNSSPASRTKFALMLENSVIMVSALVPWNIAVSLPLAILDADASSLLYAFYIWLIPLCGWFVPVWGKKSLPLA